MRIVCHDKPRETEMLPERVEVESDVTEAQGGVI
jgi:hypothetical protein